MAHAPAFHAAAPVGARIARPQGSLSKRAPSKGGSRTRTAPRRGAARMLVVEVGSPAEMDKVLGAADESLVVVDYSTSWCGPCKVIAPLFEELSNAHDDVVFVKVMGDATPETGELMKREAIRAVPAFHFWKDGKKVREFTGARTDELKKVVTELK